MAAKEMNENYIKNRPFTIVSHFVTTCIVVDFMPFEVFSNQNTVLFDFFFFMTWSKRVDLTNRLARQQKIKDPASAYFRTYFVPRSDFINIYALFHGHPHLSFGWIILWDKLSFSRKSFSNLGILIVILCFRISFTSQKKDVPLKSAFF